MILEIKNNGYKSFGLLSTRGTIETKIYENNLNNYNLKIKYPYENDVNVVSNIIDCVKSNNYNKDICSRQLNEIIYKMNTDCVVLGCTELSLILNPSKKILDPMEILAKKIVNTYMNNSKL